MKALLAVLCLVALATAERPTGRPQQHGTWQERMEKMKKFHEEKKQQWEQKRKQLDANRPTGRPTSQTWEEKMKKKDEERKQQWEEKSKQWAANRPTGRPISQTWQERMEKMKKFHEGKKQQWELKRKQWAANRPTGRPISQKRPKHQWKSDEDADETEILSAFKTHLGTFQSSFNDLMSQHQGTHNELKLKLYKQYKDAYNALNSAYLNAKKKADEAETQRKLAQLKKAAAPFMSHIDSFKKALNTFLEQNPDATESQLWNMLYKMYRKSYGDLNGARPTGRPYGKDSEGHRFAQSSLRKAYGDARKTVGKVVQKLRTDAERKQAGPYLTHIDAFQTAFEDFLAQNPKGSSSELRKMFNDLYNKHRQEMENSRPTGRPSYEDNRAYWKARDLIYKHKYDAQRKMYAWKNQMAQLMKDSGAQN